MKEARRKRRREGKEEKRTERKDMSTEKRRKAEKRNLLADYRFFSCPLSLSLFVTVPYKHRPTAFTVDGIVHHLHQYNASRFDKLIKRIEEKKP